MGRAYDVIILGAGAAGLMCAMEAGRRGRRVLVLERAERIGKKILISGGGRCNFTNVYTTAENFISRNSHFAKSALARYTPAAFIRLVEKHNIHYHEKKLGQLFCDGSAQEIVSLLQNECSSAGVEIRTGIKVGRLEKSEHFIVPTETEVFRAPRLVVATGGLSIPKIGASDLGYRLARQFGLRVEAPRPALVPIVFGETDRKLWCDLAGVSTEVRAYTAAYKRGFRDKVLFTHRGLSGPAVLQISSYWDGKEAVSLDLAPGLDLRAELRLREWRQAADWKALLREVLPRRLADRWLELNPLNGNSERNFAEAESRLHHWQLVPKDTEGFAKAEVTAGGVDTDELSAKTMECRKVPGLFFIGEVVDVTGQLGGFNFQWAWASGFCAGQAL